MSQMLSQGSQNSASSGGTGGNSNPPMGSPFVNRKKKTTAANAFATNQLRVFHVAPDPNNFGPTGSVQSGVFITCQGQFEQKQNEILFQRRLEPFAQFIAETGVVPKVFSLGPQNRPIMQGTYQKKGVCIMHQGITAFDDNTVATRETVKDYVVNYWVPRVIEVNPIEPSRMPIWDDATTYTRVSAFDEVLNDYWLAELVNWNYIQDNDTYPLYRSPRDFYCFSMRNLYSLHTPGTLSHLFKRINRLTNAHMLPADHFPIDQQDVNDANAAVPPGNGVLNANGQVPGPNPAVLILQVPQGGNQVNANPVLQPGNNVVLNDQVPANPPQVQVQIQPANAGQQDNANANDANANANDDQADIPDQVNLADRFNDDNNQVANDNPLANDPIVDSGSDDSEEEELPPRRQRRRLNQD
jgi:hypothetical protein